MSAERIPLSRVEIDDELRAAVAGAVESGRYVLGPQCRAFERELATAFGVEHATVVANGTSALLLSLLALELAPGDEVLVPAHTAFPTLEPIFHAGLTPVFVDTDETHTLAPEALERAVTSRSRVVLPVHLYGQPCDMAAVRRVADAHGLRVLEDCAQAHGARVEDAPVGSLGDLAALSFYASKNLPVLGDGGAVLTRDARLAERVRMLRDHGRRDKHTHELVGWNLRLGDLQAAAGRVFLRRLEARNAARRRIAARYRELLADLPLALPRERAGVHHVYHLFVVETEPRDALAKHLADRGVETGIHYPVPNHQQPATRSQMPGPAPALPHTEEAAGRILSLPMFPTLSAADTQRVAAGVRAFFGFPAD